MKFVHERSTISVYSTESRDGTVGALEGDDEMLSYPALHGTALILLEVPLKRKAKLNIVMLVLLILNHKEMF